MNAVLTYGFRRMAMGMQAWSRRALENAVPSTLRGDLEAFYAQTCRVLGERS